MHVRMRAQEHAVKTMYGIWQSKEQCWTSVTVGRDSTAVFVSKELAEKHKEELDKRFPYVKFEVKEWR